MEVLKAELPQALALPQNMDSQTSERSSGNTIDRILNISAPVDVKRKLSKGSKSRSPLTTERSIDRFDIRFEESVS